MGAFNIKPSPLLTRELLFLGESGNISPGTGTNYFRAYDKRTGAVLFDTRLPSFVTGAPMTYMHKGRQYVVVAISGPGKPAELVALTLDGTSENGPAQPGGVPVAAAPPSSTAAAAAIAASPEDLAVGKAQYAVRCAACHGAEGRGGAAPSLAGRTDFGNIVRVVAQGQGEMPALGGTMSPTEIEAVAKFLIKTWPAALPAARPSREEVGR